MANKDKIQIVDGEYSKEEDVQLEIVRTIPQPDLVEKDKVTIKDIKNEIEDLDKQINKYTTRRDYLLDIISKTKNDVKSKIQL